MKKLLPLLLLALTSVAITPACADCIRTMDGFEIGGFTFEYPPRGCPYSTHMLQLVLERGSGERVLRGLQQHGVPDVTLRGETVFNYPCAWCSPDWISEIKCGEDIYSHEELMKECGKK